jgi:hypothetical protein
LMHKEKEWIKETNLRTRTETVKMMNRDYAWTCFSLFFCFFCYFLFLIFCLWFCCVFSNNIKLFHLFLTTKSFVFFFFYLFVHVALSCVFIDNSRKILN